MSIQFAFAFQFIERIFGFSAWLFGSKGILDANIQHGILLPRKARKPLCGRGRWLGNDAFGFLQPFFASLWVLPMTDYTDFVALTYATAVWFRGGRSLRCRCGSVIGVHLRAA